MTEFRHPYEGARHVDAEVPGMFGFTVQVQVEDPPENYVRRPRVTVALPHQCDSWEVASEDSVTAVAVRLRLFIEEAQAALAVLDEVGSLTEGRRKYGYCAACGGVKVYDTGYIHDECKPAHKYRFCAVDGQPFKFEGSGWDYVCFEHLIVPVPGGLIVETLKQ